MRAFAEEIATFKGFILSIGLWMFGTSMADFDMILGIILKMTSLISFIILIIINLPKAYNQIIKWISK